MTAQSMHVETAMLHAGYRADPASGAVAVPIAQTTSYQFRDTEHAIGLFALEEPGHIYTRVTNPTVDVFEQRVAALEGGAAALATSSGQSAIALAIQNIACAGDNIVTATGLYGGTWNLFANTFARQGIEVRFVDASDPQNFARAADERTRAFFAETLPNPSLSVFPLAEVAQIGAAMGIPLIVDNTAAPVICRPISHGAHVVVVSATKYIGGHGNSMGGAIVDAGTFDWERHAARFPGLTRPDPSYHGAVWTEAAKPLGPIAYLLKARVTLMRDLGPCMSPFNAFLLLQGLETLALRMREHCRNARVVADYLDGHPLVARVIHPGHGQSARETQRAQRYLRGGTGALVGFELVGGREAGLRFIDALQMIYHVANIGDARTLAIHPASSTHQQLSAADQARAGVTPGYVRLSVGIEHPDDIVRDLDQALERAARSTLAA